MLALLSMAGCGGDDGIPGPAEAPPTAPIENIPGFEVGRVNAYYLVGDALTPAQDTLEVQVRPPAGVEFIDAWVNGRPGVRLVPVAGTDTMAQVFDISDLGPGDYELLLAADASTTAFARLTFTRGHALYVHVGTDWDDGDTSDQSLMLQDELHELHAELKLTHFAAPYTFTDPDITAERQALLVAWLKNQRDTFGDEIGLHIHPWCNFIEAAGVTCRTDPSTVYNNGDASGYTVMVSAYTEAEFTKLLQKADELFTANGLGTPTSFRAGGWTLGLDTAKALAGAGYLVDTSALNWARIEEWDGNYSGVLYDWNKTTWSEIGDTSQPYYISEADIQKGGTPHVGLLEVPDNGALVDYVTGNEMKQIFDANWSGGALTEPKAYVIGYHPSNYANNPDYHTRMNAALYYVDDRLASRGAGPAVYANLSDLAKIWPQP